MPYERIKFYQTGSFAVGNRLLTEDQRSVQSGWPPLVPNGPRVPHPERNELP
jgi:hypothetical protein